MKSIPRTTAWFGWFALTAAGLLPACGGTDTTTGSGGAGGTGGTGGGDTTTAPTGGGGTGGSGGATGGTGGTGGVSMGKADGDSCASSAECANGFCLTQAEFGWPNGYCTSACNMFVPCADGSSCAQLNGEPFCFQDCAAPADCADGKTCSDIGDGTMLCTPNCMKDEDCAGYGICDPGGSHFCVIPEDCDKVGDENGNGVSDCEDPYCAMKCQPQFDMACMMAEGVTAVAGTAVTKMGDNSTGSMIFVGTCSGEGNKEKVYKVTAPANQAGVLHISLTSDADLIIYARKDCSAKTGEIGCTDAKAGGEDEKLDVIAGKGESVLVFVDGSSFFGATGNEGPYTLTVNFEAQVCGDGKIVGTEQCDDGGVVAGDGCNATCNAEPKAETEPNDTKPTATVQTATAALYTSKLKPGATDEDWYQVTIGGGKTTIVATTMPAGADTCGPMGNIDTLVNVYDSMAPDPIASNEDINGSVDMAIGNYCSSVTAETLPDGMYYVQVLRTAFCDPAMAGACKDFDYGLLLQVK
jgi:cysteine-rich repeat protein